MLGSVLHMAVGIIIGAAFGRMVSSLVSDIVMPPIGLLTGRSDFSSHFLNLSGKAYATLAEAKAAGAATINYGMFLNAVFDFVIVAIAVFLLIRQVNRPRSRRIRRQKTVLTAVRRFRYAPVDVRAAPPT